MQNVKSENYISIQGWMISELGLKNAELLIYAIIYGFSQDGYGRFRGKLAYLMDWTQASKPTVLKALDALQERGLIVKVEVPQSNGQRGVEYYAAPRSLGDQADAENGSSSALDGGKDSLPGVKKFDHDGKEILPGRLKNFTGAVKKFDPDNKIIINNTIGDNNIPSSAAADGESVSADGGKAIEIKRTSVEISEEFEQAWKLYPRKEGKEQARRAYVSARRSGVSADTIRAGIEKYIEQIDRDQIAMRFVIQGGKWFEYRRWEDKPPELSRISAHPGKPPRALAYRQQHYTAEQLAALGVDFGEDVYAEE